MTGLTLAAAGGGKTGGPGDGKPCLTAQGSVVLSGGGRYLLATTAASGELSVSAVGPGSWIAGAMPSARFPAEETMLENA
jgi:hypothetical protein